MHSRLKEILWDDVTKRPAVACRIQFELFPLSLEYIVNLKSQPVSNYNGPSLGGSQCLTELETQFFEFKKMPVIKTPNEWLKS